MTRCMYTEHSYAVKNKRFFNFFRKLDKIGGRPIKGDIIFQFYYDENELQIGRRPIKESLCFLFNFVEI
jgi:hypothetical protein